MSTVCDVESQGRREVARMHRHLWKCALPLHVVTLLRLNPISARGLFTAHVSICETRFKDVLDCSCNLAMMSKQGSVSFLFLLFHCSFFPPSYLRVYCHTCCATPQPSSHRLRPTHQKSISLLSSKQHRCQTATRVGRVHWDVGAARPTLQSGRVA